MAHDHPAAGWLSASVVAVVAQNSLHLFLAFPGALLNPADQLVFLPFGVLKIVVGKAGKPLFQLAFNNVPVAFHCEFVHMLFFRSGCGSLRLPNLKLHRQCQLSLISKELPNKRLTKAAESIRPIFHRRLRPGEPKARNLQAGWVNGAPNLGTLAIRDAFAKCARTISQAPDNTEFLPRHGLST